MKKIIIATAICTAATQLWASGFQIVEQGASNLGTALAGATVNANGDASAAFWNPSASFFVNGGLEVGEMKTDSALSFIVPDFRFKPTLAKDPSGADIVGSDGGNAGGTSIVPNFYMIYKIAEDWNFTLSLTSPYGLETKYTNDFVGRYHGIKSNVMTIDINPSIAYQVCDWFSVSAGASAQYVSAELTQASDIGPFTDVFSVVKGHGWSAGFNLGMTFQYDEKGRIGVGYRSQVSHTVEGSMQVRHPMLAAAGGDVEASVSLPNVVNVGLYQRFYGDLEDFAVMVDYSWTQWSTFKDLTVVDSGSGGVLSSTNESWKDTSRVSLGMHYYPTENLTLRLGTTWDESPIRSTKLRTPRIPDANRLWIATGLGYHDDWWNVELAYAYIIFDASYMDNDEDLKKGHLQGSFSGAAHVISLQVGLKF